MPLEFQQGAQSKNEAHGWFFRIPVQSVPNSDSRARLRQQIPADLRQIIRYRSRVSQSADQVLTVLAPDDQPPLRGGKFLSPKILVLSPTTSVVRG